MIDDVRIEKNERVHRWEAFAGSELAGFLKYFIRDGAVVLQHTEVDPAFEGRGIGSRLARAALDDLRASGTPGVAECPFVVSWVRRHPAYRDVVSIARS
jgi:predicted GNAT family acetyltransferase